MLTKIRKQLNRQHGFTLVELMIVIAILGVLATIAIPRISNSIDAAKAAKIQTDLSTIGSAIALHMANNSGVLPTTLSALTPNELSAVPTMPDGSSYTYDNTSGVAYATFGGKYYYSNGRAPTTSLATLP